MRDSKEYADKRTAGMTKVDLVYESMRPLFAFSTVRFDEHTKWALGLAVAVLLAVLTPYLLESRGGRSLPHLPSP